ncbi:MAG: hypothetical protein R2713_00155 [Ilumatobacteraceae bacterium]
MPDTGAGAVVLNVTVTEAPGRGFVTVFPCGDLRPTASNLNFRQGVNVANQVTAKIGRDGHVCFFTSAETQLVADLGGWYADDVATVPGFFYEQLTPARIVDTRDGTGLGSRAIAPMAAGEVLRVTIPGAGGVPADADVRAVTMNVTVTEPAAAGYISVYPCDQDRPVVSNVNFDPANPTVANLATAKVSSTGEVCFFASAETELIVDVQGWFSPDNAVAYTALTPVQSARHPRWHRRRRVAARPGRPGRDRPAAHRRRTRRAERRRSRVAQRHDHRGRWSWVRDGLAVRHGASGRLVPQLRAGRRPGQPHPVGIGTGGDVCLFVSEGTEVVADVNGYFERQA